MGRRLRYSGLLLCLALCACEATPAGYLYVTNVSSDDVSAYRIDARTGELAPVPGSPFPAGTHPRAMAVTPSGRFAYVTNEGGSPDHMTPGSISAYGVKAATGALVPLPGTPLAAEGRLYEIVVTPSGRFVYIATVAWLKRNNAVTGNSGISAYAVDAATGALTPVAGSPFWVGGATSLAVESSGRVLYAPRLKGSGGELWAYGLDPDTGALASVPGSLFAVGSYPEAVVVAPSGRYIYVANKGNRGDVDGSIYAYVLDPDTGTLFPLTGSPFPVGKGTGSQSLALHPSGRFVYVANATSYSVSAFTVDTATGALLAPIQGSRYRTGSAATSVTVDHSGHFVYVTAAGSAPNHVGSVLAFSIDAATGALRPVRGSPFAAGRGPLSVTAIGRLQ